MSRDLEFEECEWQLDESGALKLCTKKGEEIMELHMTPSQMLTCAIMLMERLRKEGRIK